jgi:HlyD family secretion protein
LRPGRPHPRLELAGGDVLVELSAIAAAHQIEATPQPPAPSRTLPPGAGAAPQPALQLTVALRAAPRGEPREAAMDEDAALSHLWRRGALAITAFAGTIGAWLAFVPLSSAVIAPARFVVDTQLKRVQHPTGGTVGEIFVREGDRVAQGQVLIRLDDTAARANHQVLVHQFNELTLKKVRLEAQQDRRRSIDPSPELAGQRADPKISRLIDAEQKLLNARLTAEESRRSQLERRRVQLQEETQSLLSQRDANHRDAALVADELTGVRDLYKKGLVPITRLNALERQALAAETQKSQLGAALAQNEEKIAELDLQLVQLEEDQRSELQKELHETEAKLAEVTERRRTTEDQLRRIEIRSPSNGYVHQLAVHTVGGVIGAGEAAMQIVPLDESLILEAKVAPQDRDQVHVRQEAIVRLQIAHRRTAPDLAARVDRISADIVEDKGIDALPHYRVRVTIPKEELARLGPITIDPGMQADVFITTGSRTALQYLMQPFLDQASRAFREH